MSNSSTPSNVGPTTPSDTQEDVSAAVRRERCAVRRDQREFARFLASCTVGNVGPVVSAEIRAACGPPNSEHLAYSDDSSDSEESESEEAARERASLKAEIRANRREIRRHNRRFARLLARTTPEMVGAELAAEMYVLFGTPNPDHLASSESEVSDSLSDSEEEEEKVVEPSTSVITKSFRGDEDDPPPSGGSLTQAIPAC